MSYAADEQRRSWKSCRCPIYLSGTLGRDFRRKNTGCVEWDPANAAVAAIGSEGAREASGAPPIPAPVRGPSNALADANDGISIFDPSESFLASRCNRGIEESNMVKYNLRQAASRVLRIGRLCEAEAIVSHRPRHILCKLKGWQALAGRKFGTARGLH